jgi:hypothetical protein
MITGKRKKLGPKKYITKQETIQNKGSKASKMVQ